MILIDARCVLFNMLANREFLNLNELTSFAEKLKKKHNNVYVEISDKAIFSAIETYSSIFKLEENVVYKKEGYGKLADRDFLNDTVNRNFQ